MKDVQALRRSGDQQKTPFAILNAVEQVNDQQKIILIPRIKTMFEGNLNGRKIAIWGLAFKPDTDDIREAPSKYMIDLLLRAGASVSAFDPEAMPNMEAIYGDKVNFATNQYEALDGADALLIVTEWSVFRNPDFELVASKMKSKVIFDGRNLFDLDTMIREGFFYSSIGRKTIDGR